MCRELAEIVKKLLNSSNSYLRKKAGCTCIRIMHKCPDMIEDLVERVNHLLTDKNHGVMLTAVSMLV